MSHYNGILAIPAYGIICVSDQGTGERASLSEKTQFTNLYLIAHKSRKEHYYDY